MIPTIGRIVHYRSYYELPVKYHAAIIIKVKDDYTVDLQVFFDNGDIKTAENVTYSESNFNNTWDWPPRV